MKLAFFSALLGAALSANIEIADDEDVELKLFYWFEKETLYFQARFKSKQFVFTQLSNDAIFGSYYLLTEDLDQNSMAKLNWGTRYENGLPMAWMDGPTFIY